MMKKQFVFYRRNMLFLLMALCFMTALVPQANAVSVTGTEENEIELYYIGTISTSANIEIRAFGKAVCWGYVDCYPGYTADAVMRLQWKDDDGVWIDYDSWTKEGDMVSFEEYCYVPRGRTYRVRVIGDIFDSQGNWVEMVDAVTGSWNYY